MPGQADASGIDGAGLRLARRARGLSQQQLAGMTGISRSAVSAIESGMLVPSLRVALALARAVGLSVERVFGAGTPVPSVSAWPLAPAGGDGSRVALAPIGDTFVAMPLTGAAEKAGFVPASGLTAGPAPGWPPPAGSGPRRSGTGGARAMRPVRPIGPRRPTLVVAGDDPALPLLQVPLGLLDPPLGFAWWPRGGEEALALGAGGLVHAVAVYLRGRCGGYRSGPSADLLEGGADVIAFCSWREGLVLRPELADGVAGVGDLQRGEQGAGRSGAAGAGYGAGRSGHRSMPAGRV